MRGGTGGLGSIGGRFKEILSLIWYVRHIEPALWVATHTYHMPNAHMHKVWRPLPQLSGYWHGALTGLPGSLPTAREDPEVPHSVQVLKI